VQDVKQCNAIPPNNPLVADKKLFRLNEDQLLEDSTEVDFIRLTDGAKFGGKKHEVSESLFSDYKKFINDSNVSAGMKKMALEAFNQNGVAALGYNPFAAYNAILLAGENDERKLKLGFAQTYFELEENHGQLVYKMFVKFDGIKTPSDRLMIESYDPHVTKTYQYNLRMVQEGEDVVCKIDADHTNLENMYSFFKKTLDYAPVLNALIDKVTQVKAQTTTRLNTYKLDLGWNYSKNKTRDALAQFKVLKIGDKVVSDLNRQTLSEQLGQTHANPTLLDFATHRAHDSGFLHDGLKHIKKIVGHHLQAEPETLHIHVGDEGEIFFDVTYLVRGTKSDDQLTTLDATQEIKTRVKLYMNGEEPMSEVFMLNRNAIETDISDSLQQVNMHTTSSQKLTQAQKVKPMPFHP